MTQEANKTKIDEGELRPEQTKAIEQKVTQIKLVQAEIQKLGLILQQ